MSSHAVLFPFSYSKVRHFHETMSSKFYDALFLEDFGPITKGELCAVVEVDYVFGILETYNAEYDLIHKWVGFQCIYRDNG